MRFVPLLAALLLALPARAEVITRLPTAERVVALTFDACEGHGKPAFFDRAIVDYLQAEKLPATIFVTGLFAQRNRADLMELSRSSLIEIENHSFAHPQHMERLSPERVRAEIDDTDRLVEEIAGRRPAFFRFPAGNYDPATLASVEQSGHKVVHWSWESGDPAAGLAPERLKSWVLSKTRPGDILIFHVNGRAPATGKALPAMVAELKRRGFRFVRLDEVLR